MHNIKIHCKSFCNTQIYSFLETATTLAELYVESGRIEEVCVCACVCVIEY